MSLPVRPRLGSLLTLGFCLLALACTGRRALTPYPPTPEPTPPANLLYNPAFAHDTSAWQAICDAGSPVALDRDLAGFATLAVTPAAAPQAAGWSQAVPVEAGASYLISYRGHSEKLAGYADLRLAFYDARGALLWQTGGVPASGDTPWETRAWRCPAPAGAVRAIASLGVTGGSAGWAAFDDARLGLDDAPPVRALIVDYGRVVGRMRSFQGEDWGCSATEREGLPGPEAVVVPGDLALIFPDPWADPGDPASYDLQSTDQALAEAAASGAGLTFRLLDTSGEARLTPDRWAEVALHLAMHYNEAWAAGYRYGIRRWEVAGAGGAPRASEYACLAATIAAFQAHDPELQVGGPAAPAGDPGYLEGLLAYLAERGVSPAFLSWRSDYDGAPQADAVAQARVEQLLDRYGFRATEIVVSAWGPAAGVASVDAPYQAARLVATTSYWHDTRLKLAYRSCGDAVLIGGQGELSAVGETYRQLARFREAPLRLRTRGGDDLGFALLAGKSEDGKRALVAIADTGSSSREYRLALAGFPPGYRYTVREITQPCGVEVVAAGSDEQLADGILVVPWHSPAVHFVEVVWEEKP